MKYFTTNSFMIYNEDCVLNHTIGLSLGIERVFLILLEIISTHEI